MTCNISLLLLTPSFLILHTNAKCIIKPVIYFRCKTMPMQSSIFSNKPVQAKKFCKRKNWFLIPCSSLFVRGTTCKTQNLQFQTVMQISKTACLWHCCCLNMLIALRISQHIRKVNASLPIFLLQTKHKSWCSLPILDLFS